MNMQRMLLMLVMTLCAGLLTFCVVTPGLCEWAPGDPLFLEDFNDGVVPNDVTSLGWAHPSGATTWNISSDVIDQGNSAILSGTGSESAYRLNFGPSTGYPEDYTIQSGEVIAMSWVAKTPTTVAYTYVSMFTPENYFTRVWIHTDNKIYCYTNQLSPEGSGYSAVPLPAGTTEVVDIKVEFSSTGTDFFCRNHGTSNWTLLAHHDQVVTALHQVQFAGSSTSTAPMFDTIKVVVKEEGNISGKVTFENYIGSLELVPVNIDIIQDSSVVDSILVDLDESGNYSLIGLAAGTYDLRFTAAKFLSKLETGVMVVKNQTATQNTTLKNGDLDGDNQVTTSDLSSTLSNIDQVSE